ncbi:MAG: hypothetical protein KBS65_00330 [Prevotella sp.]|nr:hypothetical protein [Candidatus Equicola stercoris]
MRNLTLLTLVCLACISNMLSCTDDSEPIVPAEKTVIFYMMSDGLDSHIQNNIKDITEGSKSIGENNNILVFADFWHKNSYIFKITRGKVDTVKRYDENLCNADPNVMRNVLEWCVSNYHANSYAISIGSHGSAWLIENDTIPFRYSPKNAVGRNYDNDKFINIPTLAKVFSYIPHLDFILFDCCNMQSIELAYELRKCADYIIGVPSELPSHGAYFLTLLPEMFKSAKAVTDEYFRSYATLATDSLPISMVKADELENLAAATKAVIGYIMPENPSRINMENTIYYANLEEPNLPFLYDMNNVMLNHLPKDVYDEWHKAFDKAVPVRHGCTKWKSDMLSSYDFNSFTVNKNTFGGISMYVPHEDFISTSYNKDFRILSWSSVFPSP